MKTHFAVLLAAATSTLLGGIAAPVRADILYVSNSQNDKIIKITSDGVESVFSSSGYRIPTGLAFDPKGNLFVAYYDSSLIERFSPDGSGRIFTQAAINPTSIAFDALGNLYVASPGHQAIEKFDKNANLSLFAQGVVTPGQYGVGPVDLAFDLAGTLYATVGGQRIDSFTPAGMGSVFSASDSGGLAFDHSGNLYTVHDGTSIDKISPGGVRTVYANLDQSATGGLAFDSGGNLYAASGSSIVKVSPDGRETVFASGLAGAQYLAFTNDTGAPLSLPSTAIPAAVPEPASWALFGFGIATLSFWRRLRRQFAPAPISAPSKGGK